MINNDVIEYLRSHDASIQSVDALVKYIQNALLLPSDSRLIPIAHIQQAYGLRIGESSTLVNDNQYQDSLIMDAIGRVRRECMK